MVPWVAACSVQLLSGWFWLRSWPKGHRDRVGRMSGAECSGALFVGLARARFGLGMAASGISAAWNETLERRTLPHRKSGTRLRRDTGIGGWRPPGVMEGAYNKAKSGEVVPEMRSAHSRACALLGGSVEDLREGPRSRRVVGG